MTTAVIAAAAVLLARGTDRLVWTQSVSRSRWLLVKFTALGGAVSGLVFGAVVVRWTGTDGHPVDRFSGDVSGVTGVAAAAWFLAVFALGTASGRCGGCCPPCRCPTARCPRVRVRSAPRATAATCGSTRCTTPADRYWRFQWTETGLLLLLTAALAGVTAHQVVRRPR